MSRNHRLFAFVVSTALAACTAPRPDDVVSNDRTQPPANDQAPVLTGVDTATDPTVRRLEREAIALARAGGCSTAEQCRSAPVGSRGCGGPRFYLPYCPLTTDTAALLAKLAEVERAEQDYNRRNNIASTCEMRMPGELEIAAGACRFRTPQ
jgi:hypothetical protein